MNLTNQQILAHLVLKYEQLINRLKSQKVFFNFYNESIIQYHEYSLIEYHNSDNDGDLSAKDITSRLNNYQSKIDSLLHCFNTNADIINKMADLYILDTVLSQNNSKAALIENTTKWLETCSTEDFLKNFDKLTNNYSGKTLEEFIKEDSTNEI